MCRIGSQLTRLVAGTMVLIALGCGGKTPPVEGKGIYIEYWDYPRAYQVAQFQRRTIEEFMERHPDVRVELLRQPWQSGAQKLDIAVFSGNPPDMAGSVSNLIAYVEQDLVEPLGPFLSEEDIADFYPKSLKACQWKGEIWALPWYKTAYLMVLNKNLFRRARVEPPENHRWTWEEFVEKMEALTLDRNRDGEPEQYGLGFNIYPEEFESWGFLYTEGTEILSEDGTECLFDSPATHRGVQKLYDLVHKYRVALPRSGSMRQYQTWNLFANEWEFAASCQGTWAVRALGNRNERIRERIPDPSTTTLRSPREQVMDFDVALFPSPATKMSVLSSAGVGHITIFKQTNERKRSLCMELAKAITEGEGQQILEEYSLFPTRRSAGNIYEEGSILAGFQPYITVAQVHPMHPDWVNIDRILSKELQLAVLGTKPIDEAIRDGDRKVQRLIDRYQERSRKDKSDKVSSSDKEEGPWN